MKILLFLVSSQVISGPKAHKSQLFSFFHGKILYPAHESKRRQYSLILMLYLDERIPRV